mgnify:CR=1 FL=1
MCFRKVNKSSVIHDGHAITDTVFSHATGCQIRAQHIYLEASGRFADPGGNIAAGNSGINTVFNEQYSAAVFGMLQTTVKAVPLKR